MKQPSGSSAMFNIFYSMIPLLGFWLIEKYYGLQAGIIAAIVLSFIEVAWVYYREKRLEPFAVWSAVLIVLMGVISWITESATLILLKPAIFEGIFAVIFLFSSFIGKPFMEIMAQKQLKGQNITAFHSMYFKGLNFRIGVFFLIHTILTVYAALYLSKDAWFFVKGILFYMMFFVFFAFEFVYSRLKAKRYREKMEGQYAFLQYQQDMVKQIREGKHNE
ncbi:inner membrane-spanning protein YciB [Candidatus Uabimicrobium sp. HlEnr_7]|uniref:inner membrane-spanning protein YciB n=1 Tax=Candidatus Uabimicrobium helgolandensis TaxID=3095367 RepID=UPI003557FF1D